jgi:pyruvate-formate lyase-activating enzyme
MATVPSRSLPFRLAWLLTRQRYRALVIDDGPRSNLIYRLGYGTAHKLRNLARVREAYRRGVVDTRGRPTDIRVEPAGACNLRCPLCPTGMGEIDRPASIMKPDIFSRILDRHAQDIFHIKFHIWGEPLVSPELATLIAMAEARHVGSEISTNLSVTLSDATIDALIHAGLTWMIVSLDGTSEEAYSRYRLRGNFERVRSNVARIIARKRALGSLVPFVEWQFVPSRHNEHEIAGLEAAARELGVDGVRIKPMRVDKVQAATAPDTAPSHARGWIPDANTLSRVTGAQQPALADALCGFLWYQAFYHADGAISPCCEVSRVADDFGHLDQDFEQLWFGPVYRQARAVALGVDPGADTPRAHSPCQDCTVFAKPRAPRA